jgi:hypothetical protein
VKLGYKVNILVEEVTGIAVEKLGKFRYVVSQVKPK